VVRTGGEPHLSAGFLLWGIAEAVLVFEEKLWPDFAPDDLSRAIQVWGSQHRRFGG
jgi:undecaprenyl diphosphate synthase